MAWQTFKKNWGSSIFFIANLLNFVLATAVFTIPFPMHEVGIILGTIILAITCFISVIACTFIIEALALKNSILKQENIILDKAIAEEKQENNDSFNGSEKDKDKDKDKDRPTFLSKTSLASNIDEIKQVEKNDIIKEDNQEEQEKDKEVIDDMLGDDLLERSNTFYISKRFEISKLSKALPKIGYFFVVITIICYLYIGVTSNGIIAGNNLKDIIGRTLGIDMPEYSYYIIVICFFFITITIALNNIKHLKKFSMFIMIMRFVIIFLIMGCCFYSMGKYGVAEFKDIPKFDLSNITVMIGNSLFVFMSHHSIPGMVENFTPQKRLIKLLIIGYIFSLIFIVLYSYIGLFAFSNPNYKCDKNSEFPIAIQSTFSSNFLGLPVVGYIINYYPILNVITSGMQLITLRNNILEAIAGCNRELSNKLNFAEKKGLGALLKNFAFNTIVALPPITIGLLLQNIQSLMKYFSSILGFLLMLIVPLLVVNRYRNLFYKRKYEFSNLNRSFLTNKYGNIFVIFMSVVIFSLIIFGFVKNTKNKNCVYDE
jgi:amino acid permease